MAERRTLKMSAQTDKAANYITIAILVVILLVIIAAAARFVWWLFTGK
jgi:flagellar basal body-associated protein FliL